jgi:hypothetical protein
MSIPTVSDSAPRERSNHILPTLGMIISAQFTVSSFAKRWNHCNQLANYLARFASANEPDPERQSTLLSTFFNEVLEVLYRNQSGNGQVKLAFQRKGMRIALRAEVPVDEKSRKLYRRVAELVSKPDLDSWYRASLERAPGGEGEEEEVDSAMVGLLELVAVYDSVLKLEESTSSAHISLYFEFPYESEGME